jgi:tetratricopeptide (TPR) repeat protein
MGQVRGRQDKLDDAIAQFTQAIALRPDLSRLYRARADAELEFKDSTSAHRLRALADLERAIRLEPAGSPLLVRDHTVRGRLLHDNHRDEEALAACRRALELAQSDPDAHRLQLDILLGLKRYNDVIDSCNALLAQNTPSADPFELRGLARASLRDYAGAIEDDTAAIRLRPGSISLLNRRGWLYLLTDAPRLALRDFDEAIRLDGSAADAHLGRGSALVRLGQHCQATIDVEHALRLVKPTARMLYNAARVFAQAANVAGSEVRRRGRDAVSQVSRYRDRAVELVQEAQQLVSARERASFMSDVQSDPDLAALHRRLR